MKNLTTWMTLMKCAKKFTKCFLKIAQECIPTNIIIIRNNDRPWFNNEIRKEIRIRDRFRKTVLKFHRGRYCSGLAGEIDRPQVLFYPLIESSNIPRYNWCKNMDKVILCVAMYVSRTVLTFSTGSFKLH